MAKSGASKGAKKINAFNDGKLEGVNIALNAGPSTPVKIYDDEDYFGNKTKKYYQTLELVEQFLEKVKYNGNNQETTQKSN